MKKLFFAVILIILFGGVIFGISIAFQPGQTLFGIVIIIGAALLGAAAFISGLNDAYDLLDKIRGDSKKDRGVVLLQEYQQQKILLSDSELPRARSRKFVDRGPITVKLLEILKNRDSTRAIGIYGMGGIGKTELALELARRLRSDGYRVIWIEVGTRTVAAVQIALSRALGIDLSSCKDDLDRAECLRDSTNYTDLRYVFLDNVPAHFFIDHCLPPESVPTFITTRSNSWTYIDLYPLGVMDDQQSIALLATEDDDISSALLKETNATKQLLLLCAGHPLALRLAAARLRKRLHDSSSPIATFCSSFKNRLELFEVRPNPTESIRINFDLSYDTLPEVHQRCFRQLSIFTTYAGFSVQAASVLWQIPEMDARTIIEELHDQSLVFILERVLGRYKLHDLLAEYAEQMLVKSGEMPKSKDLLKEYELFLIYAFRQHYNHTDHLYDRKGMSWDDRLGKSLLGRDFHNPWQAVNIAQHVKSNKYYEKIDELAKRGPILAKDLPKLASQVEKEPTLYENDTEWLDEKIKNPILRHKINQMLNNINDIQTVHDSSITALGYALELYRNYGDSLGEASILLFMGDVEHHRQQYDDSISYHTLSCKAFHISGDFIEEAISLSRLTRLLVLQGKFDKGKQKLDEALRVFNSFRFTEFDIGMAYYLYARTLQYKDKSSEAKDYISLAQVYWQRVWERNSKAYKFLQSLLSELTES